MVRHWESDLHHFSEADEFLLLFSHSRKAGLDQLRQQARLASEKAQKTQNQERSATMDSQVMQEKASPSGNSRTHLAVEVLTVAAVTVLVEFFRQRRGNL